jgi:hypothetical protein
MRYVIRGFKGPEVQNFDHLYHKKDKYFEKQYRTRAELVAKQRGGLPLQLRVEKGLSIR